MSLMEAVQTVLSKYADFTGRARRSEYWYFYLAWIIVAVVLYVLALMPKIGILFLIVYWLLAIAIIVPGIAVGVRRLHDTDKSGWWVLITLIPFGALVLLVFFVLDSTPGTNQYGPNPKGM